MKTCEYCNKQFKKRARDSEEQWRARRLCSRMCSVKEQGRDPATPTEERFYNKVRRSKADVCWPWQAYLSEAGYGIFNVTKQPTKIRESWLAHRYAFMLHTGINPGEKVVMHICDNRACCNPNHLKLGTLQENMDDMRIKGRNNTKCRVTNENISNAIRMRLSGVSFSKIGSELGINAAILRRLITKRISYLTTNRSGL